MGSNQSTPAENFERLREGIESRRLRRLPRKDVTVSSDGWQTSDRLPLPGDQIKRRIGSGPCWHHAIYLGDIVDDNGVHDGVGRVCDLLADKKLARIPMQEFLDGYSDFVVIAYDNDSAEARADTVEIAVMAITEPCWRDACYDLLDNNCEHFATFCRTGAKKSNQVDVGAGVGGGILGFLSVSSVVVGMAARRRCRQRGADVDSD